MQLKNAILKKNGGFRVRKIVYYCIGVILLIGIGFGSGVWIGCRGRHNLEKQNGELVESIAKARSAQSEAQNRASELASQLSNASIRIRGLESRIRGLESAINGVGTNLNDAIRCAEESGNVISRLNSELRAIQEGR